MMPAVKRWPAAGMPVVWLLAQALLCAQTPDEAARELARNIQAVVGARQPALLTIRNLSGASAGEFARLSRVIESELRNQGDGARVEVTLCETPQSYLWVADIRRGEEQQVAMVPWPRATAAAVAISDGPIRLDKKLLWDQETQILDAALLDGGLLVLDAAAISFYQIQDGRWQLRQLVSIPQTGPWPRDLRGMLEVAGQAFRAYLPGMFCRGVADAGLTVACEHKSQPWPVRSGNRVLENIKLVPERNFFEGLGLAFYSAASSELRWIVTGRDGRAHLLDRAYQPAASISGWGSDIAGIRSACNGKEYVLASRPGQLSETDSVQSYEIVSDQVVLAGPAVEFAGPITALWPAADGASAVAVSRELKTGRYAAFSLAVSCIP